MQQELPDLFSLLSGVFHDNIVFDFFCAHKNIIYSFIIILFLALLAYFSARKKQLIPGRLQAAAEIIVSELDNFICSLTGPKGSKYAPFIGTLFVYILFMNLSGLIPFFRSSTASLSTTFALSLIVFVYVQYTAIREMGFFGYIDHLAGSPRGALAFSAIMPVFMFCLHLITELIRPISLSLRLRGNIWGDEMLIGLLSGFGIGGLPLLFFNMLMAALTAVVQAIVFCLLSAIYLAIVSGHEETGNRVSV